MQLGLVVSTIVVIILMQICASSGQSCSDVYNYGGCDHTATNMNDYPRIGNGFTTGSNAGGYKISNVSFTAYLYDDPASLSVSVIFELWNSTISANGPMATLGQPAFNLAGDNPQIISSTDSTSTTLEPNKQYYIVMRNWGRYPLQAQNVTTVSGDTGCSGPAQSFVSAYGSSDIIVSTGAFVGTVELCAVGGNGGSSNTPTPTPTPETNPSLVLTIAGDDSSFDADALQTALSQMLDILAELIRVVLGITRDYQATATFFNTTSAELERIKALPNNQDQLDQLAEALGLPAGSVSAKFVGGGGDGGDGSGDGGSSSAARLETLTSFVGNLLGVQNLLLAN